MSSARISIKAVGIEKREGMRLEKRGSERLEEEREARKNKIYEKRGERLIGRGGHDRERIGEGSAGRRTEKRVGNKH